MLAVETPVSPGPPVPPPPASLSETGLSGDFVEQLTLKALYSGEATGTGIAERVRLPYALIEPIIEHARAERLIEVRGTGGGTGTAAYRYALTDFGRDRTRQYLNVCEYIGPAPVPLSQYASYMKQVNSGRGYMIRERIADGFTHLVVNPTMLDQLGPAINSGKSLFLYGPPGNGKTVVAEGIGRTLGGELFVPYALDVDGQIITMFDPVNHRSLESGNAGLPAGLGAADAGQPALLAPFASDRRWQRIKRPVVVVGGELVLEMLDLSFNPISKFYEAPVQLKANGGVFVVDDFGRQRVPARDLLNRWIVPLESRVDYLSLHTGRKFEVPFDVLVIFATNLQPETLADEAFLRRIPYKIYARNPSPEEYSRIFELNCRRHGIAFDPVIVDYLQRRYYQPRKIDMRACHPRDLVEQVVDICRYQGRPAALSRELLDAACRSYFLEEQSSQGNEVRLK